MRPAVVVACAALCAVFAASCRNKNEPELTCRVNAVCFVCPDAKAKASCLRDPSTSRCKYADPSHCK